MRQSDSNYEIFSLRRPAARSARWREVCRRAAAFVASFFKLSVAGTPASTRPSLDHWNRELSGNELIRLPGWFEGLKTLDGRCRGEIRLVLCPGGRYLLGASGSRRGDWRLTRDGKGRVSLQLDGDSGESNCSRLEYRPDDPTAIYLDATRFLTRFDRGHLRAGDRGA